MAKNTNLPISGIGGISNWRDAAEFLMVGASTVQLCTAVMYNGYRIIEDLKSGLKNYLVDKGYNSVQRILRLALPKIVLHEELDRIYNVIAEIDRKKCVRCGLCYLVCKDAGYQAIELDRDRWPLVDSEKCDGCSLCFHRCPVLDCIKLERKEDLSQPRVFKK
jgi:dihydropyrimidine dehydrogenase (NAD+) subunit PreA